MSAEEPQLSRRDKIEAELTGCVDDHEKIRELLRRIDAKAPGLIPLTQEIRNHILDLGQRYHRLRSEMAVSHMVGDGEFEAPSAGRGQRPVNELELFVGLRHSIDESDEMRQRFAHQLEMIGDDTLVDDEQNVLFKEEEVGRA